MKAKLVKSPILTLEPPCWMQAYILAGSQRDSGPRRGDDAVCASWIKKFLKSQPKRIRLIASTAPHRGARRLFIQITEEDLKINRSFVGMFDWLQDQIETHFPEASQRRIAIYLRVEVVEK